MVRFQRDATSSPPIEEILSAILNHVASTTEKRALLQATTRLAEVSNAGAQIFWRGSALRTGLIMSGWACETSVLIDGRRQILSILIPGDPVFPRPTGPRASHVVQALTQVQITDISALLDPAAPANVDLLRAMVVAARDREDRLFSQIVRLGQLSAYERVVHFLLELRDRLLRVGLVKDNSFRMPITQDVLADALGLSLVHINRTLQQLRRERLVEIRGGEVSLLRPRALADIIGQDDWPSEPDFGGDREHNSRQAAPDVVEPRNSQVRALSAVI